MRIAQPIVRKICDDPVSLKEFEEDLFASLDEKSQEIITSFPTVYIHNWKDSGGYEVYIGESNNVFQRTRQHYEMGSYLKLQLIIVYEFLRLLRNWMKKYAG